MGKKLVKTAKQQFEERLDACGLWSEWENQGCFGRVGKELENKNIVIFVYEDDDDKFSEYFYPPYEELRKDDTFVKECLNEFTCHPDETFVYKMVYWLVYGKSECPLFPLDVYYPANHLMYPESHDFEDLYEEVPDILTAREQWEKASEKAKVLWSSETETVKVEQTETYVKFFRADDVLSCYAYPSLEEMRKDDTFAVRIVDALVESCQQDRLTDFFRWIKNGGDFPLPIEIIFHSEYQGYTYSDFEDAEEKKNGKQDFKEEMDELKAKMIAHVEQLCEQGLKLNVEVLCMNYTLTWTDRSYVICEDMEDCWFAKDNSGKWMFYRKDRDGEWDSKIEYFTIETLKDFIEALQ